MKRLTALIQRHAAAAWYVLTVILPVILRTGRRPVIFSKYSGIGDIICTFPAVLELKKKHPGAVFIFNCHKPYACLPVMGGITNRVSYLRHFGVLHHWYGWLTGACYEFPCADESPTAFCKDYVVNEYALDHQVVVSPRHPGLHIRVEAKAKTTAFLAQIQGNGGPLIVLQTGPTWPIREWPVEAWAGLIARLGEHGFQNIVQIGTSHHLSVGTTKDPVLPGARSLINRLTLEESAAVIESSQLFVGIDSGLLHIAAALRTPCVGIWGPTSPGLRLPPEDAKRSVVSRINCQGCHHRIPRIHWETGCPYNAQCMKEIAVEEVLAACLRVLNQSPRGGG